MAITDAPWHIAEARTEDDLAAVARLFQSYAGSLGVDLGYQNFVTELATLPGKYAPPNGALLLARNRDSTPIGCVALRQSNRRLLRNEAPVRCTCRPRNRPWPSPRGGSGGRGAANRLPQVRLDTLPFMDTAIALYESRGFVPIAPYYDTPVEGTRFLGLTLNLRNVRSLMGRHEPHSDAALAANGLAQHRHRPPRWRSPPGARRTHAAFKTNTCFMTAKANAPGSAPNTMLVTNKPSS